MRLNEKKLKKIVSESLRKILFEDVEDDDSMVPVNGVIGVRINGEEQFYWRTEHTIENRGPIRYVFCKVKPDEISNSDFWGISQNYYNQLKSEGNLRVVKTFGDMMSPNQLNEDVDDEV